VPKGTLPLTFSYKMIILCKVNKKFGVMAIVARFLSLNAAYFLLAI
jgi:hypothetical protein